MQCSVSVVVEQTGAAADLLIRAPDRAPAQAVLSALRTAVGLPRDTPLSLGGTPLPADGAVEDCGLREGAVVTAGLIPAGERSAAIPAGWLVHHAPRLDPPAGSVEVTFPAAPPAAAPGRLPIVAAVAPLAAGLVLSAVLRQWQFLAFAAMSPVMVLGQSLSDRRATRRTNRAAGSAHRAATRAAEQLLRQELATERECREREAPSTSAIIDAVDSRGSLLWQRLANDSDALRLRLGTGDADSRIRVVGAGPVTVADMPVTADIAQLVTLGICGPRPTALALLRSLVVQAAGLHSPAALRIVILADQHADEWAWVRWLPHVAAAFPGCALVGFDSHQVEARVRDVTSADTGERRTLVVVDDASSELRASVAGRGLLAAGDRTSMIWCTAQRSGLPGRCRGIVELSRHPPATMSVEQVGQRAPRAGVPESLAADTAEAAARALAPLRPIGEVGTRQPPTLVRWSDLAPVDLRDRATATDSLLRTWAKGPSTRVCLGRSADGIVSVELRSDGPHVLVAGTTGAGKSELLMTLIAGLAAANAPDQLSLLLIDHKGGAALGTFSRLPHTAGVVTDLDGASTQRALASLGAELRRRESRFAATGASDLDAYLAGGELHRMPRLVLVVDEFATLAESHPDFVGGLVGIAQRGRSLGVHLVLATQRPDGVVSADIRANTRLRICLGVAREQESRDVIDTADAAAISRSTPGRGYLRAGPSELRLFQTARISDVRTVPAEITATMSPIETLGDPPAEHSVVDPDTDLDVLIDAAVEAGRRWPAAPVAAPWLPPLPAQLWFAQLPSPDEPSEVAWGVVDLPSDGRQPALAVDLASGRTTLLVGAPRSGRSTAAISLVTAVASVRSPDELQLWAVDAARGLAELSHLPHCGAVVPAEDPERVDSLLGFLTAELARRRRAGTATPVLMLVVDSWEGLVAASGGRHSADLLDRMTRLAADGPSAGLHLVVTGDRGLLVGRLGSTATQRLVFRLPDVSDFALLGLGGRELPRDMPPGRAVRAGDLAVVQIAVPDRAALAAARSWPPATEPVRRFAALPDHVPLAALRAGQPDGADEIVLGVEADTLRPVGLHPQQVRSPFVVAGGPGSGRSTALLSIASQLARHRVAICCLPDSPLERCEDSVRLPRDDQEHAVALLDALTTDCAILCDDADAMAEGPLLDRLAALTSAGTSARHLVVLAASADAVAAAFRGPLLGLRRSRNGLLLGPTAPQLLAGFTGPVGLPPRTAFAGGEPRGRALLVMSGAARRLQLAEPGYPAAGTSTPLGTMAGSTATSAARACSAERTVLRPSRFDV